MKLQKALIIIGLMVCLDLDASAYLDPGTGSYILQMLVAGVLGGMYAIKLYWNKILNFFKGTSSDDDSLEDLGDE